MTTQKGQMKIGFRVNPPQAPKIEIMDSKHPQLFSLKHRFHGMINLPDEILKDIKGARTEVLLEKIRRSDYSDKPSRLSSIFIFQTIEEAKKFRLSGWMEDGGLLSAYSIIETYKPAFFASMSVFNAVGNLRTNWEKFKDTQLPFVKTSIEESLSCLCHAYWQGKTSKDLGIPAPPKNSMNEVLIEGRVELLPFTPIT